MKGFLNLSFIFFITSVPISVPVFRVCVFVEVSWGFLKYLFQLRTLLAAMGELIWV